MLLMDVVMVVCGGEDRMQSEASVAVVLVCFDVDGFRFQYDFSLCPDDTI